MSPGSGCGRVDAHSYAETLVVGLLKIKDMEMGWAECGIESQAFDMVICVWLRLGRRGQLGPPPGGGIADDEPFLFVVEACA
jgi:hypothetical protein